MIDAVITYVDNTESVWQNTYLQYQQTTESPRFRTWDNLKYWFRAIETNMKFINKIHIVVSNIEQIPYWLNTDIVHVVLHKDIIPEKYLPTFNSTTIEMFLHNIEGLSENFLYFNDDMFPLKISNEIDFFENNLPKYDFKYRQLAQNVFRMQCKNSFNLICKIFNVEMTKDYFYIKHTATPMTKQSFKSVWNLQKEEIEKRLTQFRMPYNFTQYLFPLYNVFSEQYIQTTYDFKYIDIIDETSISNDIFHQITCFNDCEKTENFEYLKFKFIKLLSSLFPNKSKFEL